MEGTKRKRGEEKGKKERRCMTKRKKKNVNEWKREREGGCTIEDRESNTMKGILKRTKDQQRKDR